MKQTCCKRTKNEIVITYTMKLENGCKDMKTENQVLYI